MALRDQAFGKSRISTNLRMSYLKLAEPMSQIAEKRNEDDGDDEPTTS